MEHVQYMTWRYIISIIHKVILFYADLSYLQVMLTDFGLAKEIDESSRSNSLCGTTEYMAPEILLSKGHNKNADWWSTGILLYEMLSGQVWILELRSSTFKYIVRILTLISHCLFGWMIIEKLVSLSWPFFLKSEEVNVFSVWWTWKCVYCTFLYWKATAISDWTVFYVSSHHTHMQTERSFRRKSSTKN